MKEERLLTSKELASLLGISGATLVRLVRSGRIPYVRIGRRAYRFYFKEVEEALRVPMKREE